MRNPKCENKSVSENIKAYNGQFGIRHLQAFIIFLCLFVAYSMRVNLSVAIVAMVDKNSTNPDFEEFKWDTTTQSIVLSSFFWGYIIGQIPSGHLAQIYGPKILLLILMGLCSILNIITPLIVSFGGWKAVVALRSVQGLTQSAVIPSAHILLSKWAPITERGRISTFCFAGAQLGTVSILSLSGVLAESSMGWPSIFYVSGAAGILWSILWLFMGSNSPAECTNITQNEKEFIEDSLGTFGLNTKELKTPWKSIFTSIPFLALIFVSCGYIWGFWTLLTEIPTYMKNVHGVNLKKNAMLTATPYLSMWILSIVFSYIADLLIIKDICSIIVSRKIFSLIGTWIPMGMLIALGYVSNDNAILAIILLTVAVGVNAACYVGFMISHLDMAPNFVGILVGITNFASNSMSIIAPLVVGIVIEDEKDPTQWRIIFFVAAGMYFMAGLIFLIFGKAEIQSWNSYIDKISDKYISTSL